MSDDVAAQLSLIEIAIEPKSKADQQKLGGALAKLAAEDPSFDVSTDPESGQTILKGTSEEHLDAKVGLLKRDGINANIGAPQVAFRECITQRVEHSYTHKRQAGGSGQFAAVTLLIEPNGFGKGNAFESDLPGSAVPEKYHPWRQKGSGERALFRRGRGFSVVDIKVQLIDGKYHDVNFVRAGFRDRDPRLLPRSACERQSRFCSNRS